MASFIGLPLEIMSLIAESLQEFDVSSKPFAHLAGTIPIGSPEWKQLSSRSKRDVCNFRLVCRKATDAAKKSFGNVISNRTFRMTPANVQDLLDLWTTSDLAPYIKL